MRSQGLLLWCVSGASGSVVVLWKRGRSLSPLCVCWTVVVLSRWIVMPRRSFVGLVYLMAVGLCPLSPALEESDETPALAHLKETPSGSVVSEYDWSIANILHLLQLSRSPDGEAVPGPEFYTGRPGYNVRLSLTAGRLNPDDGLLYLGVWFLLVPGVFDDDVEWPFPYTVNLTLVGRGEGESVHLSVNPKVAACRLRKQFLRPREAGRPDDGCGKTFFISHERLLEVRSPFVLANESLLLRATFFVEDRGPTPKDAKPVMRGHQLVSEFVWEVTNIDEQRRGSHQRLTSDLFYVNSESYLMVLQLVLQADDVGLFATLLPGDHDHALQWPFALPFELALGPDRKASVDPTSGLCPLAAFTKPRRGRPNAPCGFRRLGRLTALRHRNGSLVVRFTALMARAPRHAAPTLRQGHLAAEFRWRVPNIERKLQLARVGRLSNLLSERFYATHQGYLMQLQIKFENSSDGRLGLFLTLLEGEHDALLEWPFSRRFQLFVVDQQEAGQDIVVPVDPRDPYITSEACSGSFWRPFGRNDACGSSSAVRYDQLYDRKFIRFGAILLKVAIFLDEIRPPRFATLAIVDNHLAARFEWLVPGLEDKIHQTTAQDPSSNFVDSDKFYLSNNGYRMMLRLYPEKTSGFVGLYAVLASGAYDGELQWPFRHQYSLEVVHPDGGASVARATYPGGTSSGCPEVAFRKPEMELSEWSCGEGHMVAHETLRRRAYAKDGAVRFALTVFLQEVVPQVGSVALQNGLLVTKYSWIVQGAEEHIRLLQAQEKERLESPVFYTENQGYAMRLSLSLSRFPILNSVTQSQADSYVVSLYWTIYKGQYDDALDWPFRSLVTIAVVDPTGIGDMQKVIDPLASQCTREAFQRPKAVHNEHSCGFAAVMALEPFVTSYVRNDVMHIRTSVRL